MKIKTKSRITSLDVHKKVRVTLPMSTTTKVFKDRRRQSRAVMNCAMKELYR